MAPFTFKTKHNTLDTGIVSHALFAVISKDLAKDT